MLRVCESQSEAERGESKKGKRPICFFFDGSLNLDLNSKNRETPSTPPPAFAPVPPPPHPTYDLISSIRAALEEDAGDVGDLTTLAT